MSEWISLMRTDHEPPGPEVYIKRLEKKLREQDKALRLHHKFKHRYINYLQRLNDALFAENSRLKKQLRGSTSTTNVDEE